MGHETLNCPAADKEDIIPPVPALTRYRKESGIKAFVKKELTDSRLPDVRKSSDINVLTTPTLCVQLNTLYVSSSLKIFPPYGHIFFVTIFIISLSPSVGNGTQPPCAIPSPKQKYKEKDKEEDQMGIFLFMIIRTSQYHSLLIFKDPLKASRSYSLKWKSNCHFY